MKTAEEIAVAILELPHCSIFQDRIAGVAELVRAYAEQVRERCAKVAKALADKIDYGERGDWCAHGQTKAALEIERRIRALEVK